MELPTPLTPESIDSTHKWYLENNKTGQRWKIFVLFASWSLVLLVGVEEWRLRSEIGKLEKDNVTLAAEKRDLITKANHFEEMLNPLQQLAREAHPELNNQAALLKLAKEFQELKALATQGDFLPLSTVIQNGILSDLNRFRTAFQAVTNIDVDYEPGNVARQRVAGELSKLVKEAGFSSRTASLLGSGTSSASIAYNVDLLTEAAALVRVFKPAFNVQTFIGRPRTPKTNELTGKVLDRSTKSQLAIAITGDPIFSTNGVVSFK